ncbi:MAG TPA: hypothetical protein VFP39_14595 [Gemmatimonadales bacterium]|nr:hypothetical protein [Gemmatimonadales bacterium]
MIRRTGGWMLGVLALAAPLPGQRPADTLRWAMVTYLTTASAYIDAGRAEGVTLGARVDVVRGGESVARLRVAFLATHQAACDIVVSTTTLAVGDSVRYAPAVLPPDSTPRPVLTYAPVAPRSAPRPGSAVRGRVGLYYLTVRQQDGSGAILSQPSGDLRLIGSGLGGGGVGLLLDVRSRYLTQVRADGLGTDSRAQTRVYQGALSWQTPASPFRITAGRQFAPGIVTAGLVDGVSGQIDRPGWGGGGFVGTQPEPLNLGFSSQISQFGAYVQRRSSPDLRERWSVTGGLSGSYLRTATNREFIYLQGDYATQRLSLYAAQEIDYYRPWRRVGGESALSPTSSFATLQFQLTDAVSLTAGLDNRRNVRLYRDVVNPEIAFDDSFRRGAWAGVAAHAGRFQVGLDGRLSSGGSTGLASSYTVSLEADRITGWELRLRSRGTRYTSVGRGGWLGALSLGVDPWSRGSLLVTGGWRSERDATMSTGTLTIRWVSADLDVNVFRAWAAVLSVYSERGGTAPHDLLYSGMMLRF